MHILCGVQPGNGEHLPQLRRRAQATTAADEAGMNYRHAYHAGNFADVHKHVALVAILRHLKKKEAPFAIIDTHAGRGAYDLSGEESVRSGEAGEGIARLSDYSPFNPALVTYLECVRAVGPLRYPGSPLIAAMLLRPQDRLVAMEKHAEEFEGLHNALTPAANARAILADGYARLPLLVPPPERRGLILVDPPYEDAQEMQKIANAFAQAYRRFTTGIYFIWYPLKSAAPADALAGELKSAGAGKLLSLCIDVGRKSDDPPGRLSASSLLVANPPYGFAAEMEAAQAELLPLLARGAEARSTVTWLASGC
jgi:23S rRNA (adenine2030-N6)-methyltransferase